MRLVCECEAPRVLEPPRRRAESWSAIIHPPCYAGIHLQEFSQGNRLFKRIYSNTNIQITLQGYIGNLTRPLYRDEINSLQIQLSRTQAGSGRAVKEQKEQNSPNHVQRINLISVYLILPLNRLLLLSTVFVSLISYHHNYLLSWPCSTLRGRRPRSKEAQPLLPPFPDSLTFCSPASPSWPLAASCSPPPRPPQTATMPTTTITITASPSWFGRGNSATAESSGMLHIPSRHLKKIFECCLLFPVTTSLKPEGKTVGRQRKLKIRMT